MKKLFHFFALCSLLFALNGAFALEDNGLSDARELADRGIIVNQSSMNQAGSSGYGVDSSSDIQESAMYRLDENLIRQEALGVALKLKGTTPPDPYICKNYFRDTSEWWVCRAAEISADGDIVTRANLYFRPYDSLTVAEGLAITLKALGIPFSKNSTASISGTLPDWQKRLILTIEQGQITMNVRDDNGKTIAFYDATLGSGFEMSHRLTRGQFFQIVMALLNYKEHDEPTAHCVSYNDGCNDCVRMADGTSSCTERMCFWQGIPKCYTCEEGYALQNDRCVKQQTACVREGEAVSNYSLPPQYQSAGICCAGLTSVGPREQGIVGAPNICANIGDGVCDARYESAYNSSDCHDTPAFDSSICQSYYDGCNSCSKTTNGTMCTLRACMVDQGPAYCTSYIAYTPVNQSQDATFLGKVTSEIKNYTADRSCTTNSDCRVVGLGEKACGGPLEYIHYSTSPIDIQLLADKVSYLSTSYKKYNQTYSIMSDCAMMMPPATFTCQSGVCR